MLCKLNAACHCTSAKCINSILRHVAEAFPPARQGTILNSHRVIRIATITSMVLNCAFVNGCSLTSYPGRTLLHSFYSLLLHSLYAYNITDPMFFPPDHHYFLTLFLCTALPLLLLFCTALPKQNAKFKI